MRRVAVVFLGGGLGSVLRAGLITWLAPGGATAPVLMVNLLGAFVLGMVYVLADEAGLLQATTRLFLAVGVLGGFTTFSTFIWGADLLVTAPTWGAAVNYLVASVGGGVAAVVAGLVAARELVLALRRGALPLLARRTTADPRRPGEAARAPDTMKAEDRDPLAEGEARKLV
jgi:CrcB protein